MALKPAEKTVKIEFGIVELNQPVNGTVGFCGLFDYYIFRPPLSHAFETGLKYEDLNELPKLFLKEINIKSIVDCSYENIKDFDYFKYQSRYPSILVNRHGTIPKGYIEIFDIDWVMYHYSLDFFNKYFKCDYYLTGWVNMAYIPKPVSELFGKSSDKYVTNLFLVLYDNKGFRIWSNIYQKEFVYIEKNENFREVYYSYLTTLINECKSEINKDLLLIGVKR